MSRISRSDIVNELIELIRDVSRDILQQLQYYRASVYKTETASQINLKIEELRLLAAIIGDDLMQDLFNDFDVTRTDGNIRLTQGECLFSYRVSHLLQSLGTTLDNLLSKELTNDLRMEDDSKFRSKLRSHRRQILNLCSHGSRTWHLFQSL